MTPNEFVYWLQGFFEISEAVNVKSLNEAQTQIVKDHLKLVLKKETPIRTWSGTCGVAGHSSGIAGEVSTNSTC